jgi:hypothetical protein
VDTTSILFVCGGAFSGLEKIISARGRSASIGFSAKVIAPEDRKTGEIFRDVEPEDLLKYGLIPEFVGRLPVVATLEDLDEAALKRILTEPKNALVKQYQRLFEMESVDLTLPDEALGAISKKAMERNDGGEGAALDHGGHSARHHVRSAEPRGGRGSRDLEASRRGHCAAALHLRRSRGGCGHCFGQVTVPRLASPSRRGRSSTTKTCWSFSGRCGG